VKRPAHGLRTRFARRAYHATTMRVLTVSVPVEAPAGFTLAFLQTYFREATHGAQTAKVRLRLPTLTAVGGVSVEKTVEADVKYELGHGKPAALEVAWTPEASGAFPKFSGAFHASDDSPTACRLVLTGTYAAPGGAAGGVFDAIVGRRIARATIAELLERLALAAAKDYAIRSTL
jgi:hypothetical protein